jgi:hypothetical protein
MKKIMKLAGVMLLVIIAVSSCKKDDHPLDFNFTPIAGLATPEDNAVVKLDPSSSADVLFKWNPASTDDGGVILYEFLLDKEGGDFSKPVYKTMSGNNGVYAQISITHKDLTNIANSVGIAASSTGKLKWMVIASKGTNKVPSPSRTLILERSAGFTEYPADLFITGSATEGGTDLSKAIKLKKTSDGAFEIYTSLKSGDYILTDKNTDGGKKYYIDNGVIKEGATPVTVSGVAKAYRLNFDFSSAAFKSVEIQSIGLFMSAYSKEIGTLNYIGNGVFEAPSIAVEFFQFSWGRDERYKFIIHTASGLEYVGSKAKDNGSPAGQPASYFYLNPTTNDQWDFTYKFDPSADKKNVKVDVMLQPNAYTHKVTVL